MRRARLKTRSSKRRGTTFLSVAATPALGPTNTVPPAVTGTAQVGQNISCTSGTWTGNGPVTFEYQRYRNGTPVGGLVSDPSFTATVADGDRATSYVVHATDADGTRTAASNAVTIIHLAPTFSVQPTISPSTGTVGSTFTMTEGVAGQAATLTIETFDLGPIDKSGELSGLTWDSSGETADTIAFRVRATNSGGTVLSNIINATLSAAPTVPATSGAPVIAITGSDSLTLTLPTPPDTGGSPLTAARIEWRPVGGGAFTIIDVIPANFGNAQPVAGLTASTDYEAHCRFTNAVGDAIYSTFATGTTNAAGDVTAPIIATMTISGGNVDVSVDEGGTAYWMASDNTTETGAAVEAGGGLASGNFAVTAGANSDPIDISALTYASHYLHLVVKDAASNRSLVSSVQFDKVGAPAISAAPTVTSAGTDSIDITLPTPPADNNSPITGARIEWRPVAGGALTIIDVIPANFGVTQSVPSGLAAGTAYEAHCRFENAAGNAAYSPYDADTTDAASPTVPATSDAPVIAITGSTSMDITLPAAPADGGSAILGARIQWRTTGSGAWTVINVTPANFGNSQSVGGLTPNTSHEAQALFHNAVGDAAYSASDTATTDAGGGSYVAKGIAFDASNTMAISNRNNAGTYSQVASKQGTFIMTFRVPTLTGIGTKPVAAGRNAGVELLEIDFRDNGSAQVKWMNAADTEIAKYEMENGTVVAGTLHTLMISFDTTTGVEQEHIYFDGADMNLPDPNNRLSTHAFVVDGIASALDEVTVGDDKTSAQLAIDVAHFTLSTNYVDLSVPANRAKFEITADPKLSGLSPELLLDVDPNVESNSGSGGTLLKIGLPTIVNPMVTP